MAGLKSVAYRLMHAARARLDNALDARWDNDPFGPTPKGTRDEYLALFNQVRRSEYPAIVAAERDLGFSIDLAWLDELALHTQVVKKASDLAYPHGRLLYSLLRRYIVDSGEQFLSVFETGTARGFSAICMAKAIDDAGVDGRIVTVDVLPHSIKQYWNCIDDSEGKKTRAELLAPWADMTKRILFLQGDTLYLAPKVGLERINFAFLDSQHTEQYVLAEFETVSSRQQAGDMIVFDDVTPAKFPGVVRAIERIERRGNYVMNRLILSDQRAYAWGVHQ